MVRGIPCSDPRPHLRDRVTVRHANQRDQIINALGFGVFGGAGALLLSANCTAGPDATASIPNPPSHPCTSSERAPILEGGAASAIVGALFGAAFIYNMVRAADTKETVRLPQEWIACVSAPVPHLPMVVTFADGQKVTATTDAEGHARFELATLRLTDEALKPAMAQVIAGKGQRLAPIDLTGLPQYVEWQKEEEVKRQAEQKAEEAKRQAGIATTPDTSAPPSPSDPFGGRPSFDTCFAEMNEAVSRYEHIPHPTDDQAVATVEQVGAVLDRCTGSINPAAESALMMADARFEALRRRLAPAMTKKEAAEKRQAEREEKARAIFEAALERHRQTPEGRREACESECDKAGNACLSSASCAGEWSGERDRCEQRARASCNASYHTCLAGCQR